MACVAGMVNVVGVLGFEHQALTHLTGTTTLLGAAVYQGKTLAATQLLGIIAAYVAGAILSGVIIQGSSLRLGRRYGVVLSIESAMLFATVPLFQRDPFLGALIGATAMGLQNAMATTFSGAVLRTTHLTGMFTDLGIGIGHAVRGKEVPRRRILLSALVNLRIFGRRHRGGAAGSVLRLRRAVRTRNTDRCGRHGLRDLPPFAALPILS